MPSIVPATGLHSESKTVSEGYLQSKDLQRDLFSISCLPYRPAQNVRRKWRLPERKTHTVACFRAPTLRPCHPERSEGSWFLPAALPPPRFPNQSRLWKSSGNPVGCAD